MIVAAVAIALWLGTAPAAKAALAEADQAAVVLRFNKDVLPVLQANCLRCHSSVIKMGGLDLSTLAGMLLGSSAGVVVTPGNPDASPLYNLVQSGVMPYDHQTQVSPAQLETIRHWIEALPAGKEIAPDAGSSSQHAPAPVVLDAPSRDNSPASTYRAALNQYCITCHNVRMRTAGLALDKLDLSNVAGAEAVWERVADKLRARAMPPAGLPRPDQSTYDSVVSYLEATLDRAAETNPHPGRPAIHRLNRTEYRNAVRDLLAIDVDIESLLPADDSGYGFDNIADVLSVSPMLLERYMAAAGRISRLAIGDPGTSPNLETYDIPKLLIQDGRMSEDLPFGSRGGFAVRHNFPLDGEYTIRIRLRRTHNGNINDGRILGLSEPHQLEVRLDGARIKLFTVGGGHPIEGRSGREEFLRREAAASRKTPQKNSQGDKYEYTADAALEFRIPVKAGPRLVGVDFLNDTAEPEGPLQPRMAALYSLQGYEGTAESLKEVLPAIAQVTIGGPYDAKGPGETASRSKIFLCYPTGSAGDVACAEKILSVLARHAYRRPVADQDLEALLGLYKLGKSERGFEAGIGTALQGILVNPEFLFRIERDPADVAPHAIYRVGDLDLASRLSFFLWSSIPDDQLLELAAANKLKDPEILEQQVRRMVDDPRSEALVRNFAGEWLYLRNMRSAVPDPEEFPDFDENLREAFQRETELFFDSNLHEDHSVLDLLRADYTFVNDRLARFYGIPNIYGSQFRRISLNGHDERRGLLGQGSILTVTSYANRTSPTVRGKWLLENVLGAPPPPPPPDAPSLKEENGEPGKILTMRQRMEEHRANPACSVCHTRMDPLGFALENFDGIGKWRPVEGNTPIDASGVLPDGTKFEGPAGLRDVLLGHPEEFVTTATEKLLTYALGRGLEYYDAPAVRKIVRDAAPSGYRWSSIILGVVKSTPFQMREALEQ